MERLRTLCSIRLGVCVALALAAWLTLACPYMASAEEFTVCVRGQAVELLRSPDYDGEVIRVAEEGEQFTAVTTVKDFYLVKDEASGSFLYIPFTDADKIGEAPKKILVSGRMPMPEHVDLSYWQVAPDQEDDPQESYKMRSSSHSGMLTAHNGKKYPASYDYNDGYRPRLNGQKLVRDAMAYLGTDYVLGGTSKSGIDCSGLTKVCAAKQGVDLLHRSSLQALEGKYIPHDELRAGDLVFFRDTKDSRYLSHVGIYVGNGRFIHASRSKGGVEVTPLSEDYFKNHYAFARRL